MFCISQNKKRHCNVQMHIQMWMTWCYKNIILPISHKFFDSFLFPFCLTISWHAKAIADVISKVVLLFSWFIKKSHLPKFNRKTAHCSTISVLGKTVSFVCRHISQAFAKACLSIPSYLKKKTIIKYFLYYVQDI